MYYIHTTLFLLSFARLDAQSTTQRLGRKDGRYRSNQNKRSKLHSLDSKGIHDNHFNFTTTIQCLKCVKL